MTNFVRNPMQQPGMPAPQSAPGQTPAQSAPKTLSIIGMSAGLASVLFGWTLLLPVIGVVVSAIALRKEPAGRVFAITGLAASGLTLLFSMAVVIYLLIRLPEMLESLEALWWVVALFAGY